MSAPLGYLPYLENFKSEVNFNKSMPFGEQFENPVSSSTGKSKASSEEQKEAVKSGQEIAWEQKRAEVDKITDKLGLGVDEKIKEAVIAFRVHEFPTCQSCEGHLGEKEEHGEPFPWVHMLTPEPKGWRQSEEKKREWTIENLKQQQKMMDYLAEFYKDRETLFDARLTFKNVGAFGGFRVQSFGSEMMELLSSKEQKSKLELYRKEMDNFAQFLKDKHFSKE